MIKNMDSIIIPKKSNKEKVFLFIIIFLVTLLIVAFAYIQVQKSVKLAPEELVVNESVVEQVNVVSPKNEAAPEKPQAILVGASPVNSENKVLNDKLTLARNDAIPNSPEAPKSVVVAKESLPQQTLNLEIGNSKIAPSSFSVNSGDLISLAVTSADKQVHVFAFYDQAVSAIAIGISEGQTKAINFNAPPPGEYTFACGVPQHKEKGETGKMIVK